MRRSVQSKAKSVFPLSEPVAFRRKISLFSTTDHVIHMTGHGCAMRKAAVFSILFVVVLLVVTEIAEAQQQAKILKIGALTRVRCFNRWLDLCLRGFRKLGYVEGKNVTFERRFADDQLARLAGLADELVRLKVDVLLTPGRLGRWLSRKPPARSPSFLLEPFLILLRRVSGQPRTAWGEYHGVHHHCGGFDWQTTGVAQTNHSETLARCSAVGSKKFRQCAIMER